MSTEKKLKKKLEKRFLEIKNIEMVEGGCGPHASWPATIKDLIDYIDFLKKNSLEKRIGESIIILEKKFNIKDKNELKLKKIFKTIIEEIKRESNESKTDII
jgi:hypothetical protein